MRAEPMLLLMLLAGCVADESDLSANPSDTCRVDADCSGSERCVWKEPGCGDGVCVEETCDDDTTFTVYCGCQSVRVFGDQSCSPEPYRRVQTNSSPCEGIPAFDAGRAVTPCLDLECDAQTEICVIAESFVRTASCVAVPTGCENDRTCGCFPDGFCGNAGNLCSDDAAVNTVQCICTNC